MTETSNEPQGGTEVGFSRHAATFAELCERVEAIEDALAVCSFVLTRGDVPSDSELKRIVFPFGMEPDAPVGLTEQGGHETFEQMIERSARYTAGLRQEADRVDAFMADLQNKVDEHEHAQVGA
jgi:hypothetical protein